MNVRIYAFTISHVWTFTQNLLGISKDADLAVLKRGNFREAVNVYKAPCGSRFPISKQYQPFHFVIQHQQQELSMCIFFQIHPPFSI